MKARLKIIWIQFTVFTLLSSLQITSAHYDPAAQGWLNRDPLKNAERKEGPNLYRFVHNRPTFRIDRFGLTGWDPSRIPNSPDPECNGDVMETSERLEAQHGRDAGAGGFRHCYSACALRKCFGPVGGCTRRAWDAAYEDANDPHSAADMRAEDVGESIGRRGQSCEDGCLAAYQEGNEGYP